MESEGNVNTIKFYNVIKMKIKKNKYKNKIYS